MFQYALGRAIAYQSQALLKLDISGFEEYQLRRYELDCFNIQAELATREEIQLFTPASGFLSRLKKAVSSGRRGRWTIIREEGFPFSPSVLEARLPAYFSGYWQTEKYFAAIAPVIRQDFSLRYPLSNASSVIVRQMQELDAISLHVRRGDYVTNPETQAFHGTCSIQYYEQAAKLLAEKTHQPHFFIFSDDPEWVQQNLHLPYPATYVTHNGPDTSYEDMYLMSRCKHHIIANSSFSWWGAWLNPNPQKRVIAPRRWFNKPDMNTRDLIPEGWLKL